MTRRLLVFALALAASATMLAADHGRSLDRENSDRMSQVFSARAERGQETLP